MLLTLVLCVTVSYVLFVLWSRRHVYRMHQQLKNETWSLPLLGNTLLFLGDDEDRMKTLQRFGRIAISQGGLTSVWFGPKCFVMVADADVVDKVLKSCHDKDENMYIARELLGNGSIVAPLTIWRTRRKILAPIFSMRNLTAFVSIFSRNSCIMVDAMSSSVGKGTFSVWKFLTSYTMDAVCETTLGVKVNAQRSPSHSFLQAFERHCQMGAFRLLLPPIAQKGYKYLPIYDEYKKHIQCIHEFVDKVIKNKRITDFEQRRSELNDTNTVKSPQSHKSFLDLLTKSSTYTDIELREETLVLILAGTDTSAVAAAFICVILALYTDVQDTVYDELREVFGDSKEPVTAADLPRLKYLEAVIKETMRLYPPVPIITRRTDKHLILPSGLSLIKDTPMLINIWAIHRNPHYWGEDAEQFRPDRFLESKPIHPAAYIPFSYGPRSCLGYQYAMMSIKTTLSTLLRRYKLLPATSLDRHTPLRVKFDIMMKHVDNFELMMESRN